VVIVVAQSDGSEFRLEDENVCGFVKPSRSVPPKVLASARRETDLNAGREISHFSFGCWS
jgi:hypothetical protein